MTDMLSVFYTVWVFNQDLSGLCVDFFPSQPTDYDEANNWTLPRPVWGTCPP